MATLHKGKSKLVYKGLLFIPTGILMMVFGFYMLFGGLRRIDIIPHGYLSVLAFIAMFLVFAGGRGVIGLGLRYLKGAFGEKKTAKYLTALPKDYHVFTNVRVHEKMEADAVVVGENGVFVVETKNYNGRLEGSSEDKTWIMHKIGRKGGSYTKKIPNPIRQLKRNIFEIASYLKTEGCPAWVEGCIVFPNSNTTFGGHPGFLDRAAVSTLGPFYKMKDDYIPDSRCIRPDSLSQYILGYQPRRKLSAKQIADINKSLDKCIR